MKISETGISLIKQFEGCKLEAYQDQIGRWTIGYGHAEGVQPGSSISNEDAQRYLEDDAARCAQGVSRLLTRPVTQAQFDALCSFSFNLGVGSLERSSLLGQVNAGQFKAAADEFLKWCRAGGKEVPGLLRRREAERALFIKE